jgi:alanyl-tRNA synthetase
VRTASGILGGGGGGKDDLAQGGGTDAEQLDAALAAVAGAANG